MTASAQKMVGGGPNGEVIAFWRDVMVRKYRRFRRVLVDATAAHTQRALARHAPAPDASVLDVGCGFGETTIAWARRVGGGGHVVGLDPCEGFLEVARADAEAARATNATFVAADAQTARLRDFDRVFSAFGVMFFAQPVAALRNLRAALNPGGRMQLLVWGNRTDNRWLTLAVEASDRILPPVPAEAATCGPGPFSMSDPDALRAMLERAGLAHVELHDQREDVFVGDDVERAIDFQLTIGPAGERMRVAGALGTPQELLIREELRRAFARAQTSRGIWLPSRAWYATGVA